MNDSNLYAKELTVTSKLLPLIYCCIAADFGILGLVFLFQTPYEGSVVAWVLLLAKLIFYCGMKIFCKRKTRSVQLLFHEFLAVATITQIFVYLAVTAIMKSEGTGCCDTFLAVFSVGSAIMFMLWGIVLFATRVNFLSKYGFYALVGILLITLLWIVDPETVIFSSFFSFPFVIIFFWTWATRKALFNKSAFDESDFKLFFGFFNKSTGLKG